jgi:CHAT domain-containing protein
VFAPVRRHLPAGTKRLFLCPDAALAAVPFAALPGGVPGSRLVDEFDLVHVELAQDLVPAASLPDRGRGALVVGGVDYGAADPGGSPPAPPPAHAPREGGRWAPLPATGREARFVASRLPDAITLSGAAATEERVRELSRGKAILHLATHGYVVADRLVRARRPEEEPRNFDAAMARQLSVGTDPMLLAGVVLAGADGGNGGGGDDGLLTAAEVSWFDLEGMGLAVLSACETGRGTPAAGEGTLGLVRGFRLAGARRVVASLWKVDDDATALWMERFYEAHLGRGLEPSAAAREAAIAVRGHTDAAGKRPFSLPRFWAAFVVYGP